jgi:hypothetical protein
LQLAAPTVLYDPAAQLVQAAAPVVPLYLPATHSVHAAALIAAGVALALPASHCDEVLGERQVVFALASPPPHLTCSQLDAPTALMYDPAAQLVQAATPLEPLNLPATHSSHSSPGARKVHDTPTSYWWYPLKLLQDSKLEHESRVDSVPAHVTM